MAKTALRGHLRVILDQPEHYLAKFCYAMDFVWAKCAFCFLLLLKLTRLLPEDDSAQRQLLDDGRKLLREFEQGRWRVDERWQDQHQQNVPPGAATKHSKVRACNRA